jgi:hypothetical protein
MAITPSADLGLVVAVYAPVRIRPILERGSKLNEALVGRA